jgi:hypothetical protein
MFFTRVLESTEKNESLAPVAQAQSLYLAFKKTALNCFIHTYLACVLVALFSVEILCPDSLCLQYQRGSNAAILDPVPLVRSLHASNVEFFGHFSLTLQRTLGQFGMTCIFFHFQQRMYVRSGWPW